MKNVLVSGASGFIGRHLVASLLESQPQPVPVSTAALEHVSAGVPGAPPDAAPHPKRSRSVKRVGVLVRPTRVSEVQRLWPGADVSPIAADLLDHRTLRGVCDGFDTVFHLAGYAHADDANEGRADEVHWQITVDGTRALLREAAYAGARRFVFASTVKAMGEGGEVQLDESSTLEPASGYGRAKREAEQLVLAAGREYGMHTCVLRFPLVYGRDNKGNLPRMISAIDRGRFPPLPAVENRRSMVHVDDVVQALVLAAEKPAANGQMYLVTDGQAYSARQIETLIRRALGKPLPRWAVPASVLRFGARLGDVAGNLLHRRMPLNTSALEKLLGSAWYSNEKIRRELSFRPRRTLADALPEMVEEYRRGSRGES
jgi:nucleoside-diphosphate-sugar epimerase